MQLGHWVVLAGIVLFVADGCHEVPPSERAPPRTPTVEEDVPASVPPTFDFGTLTDDDFFPGQANMACEPSLVPIIERCAHEPAACTELWVTPPSTIQLFVRGRGACALGYLSGRVLRTHPTVDKCIQGAETACANVLRDNFLPWESLSSRDLARVFLGAQGAPAADGEDVARRVAARTEYSYLSDRRREFSDRMRALFAAIYGSRSKPIEIYLQSLCLRLDWKDACVAAANASPDATSLGAARQACDSGSFEHCEALVDGLLAQTPPFAADLERYRTIVDGEHCKSGTLGQNDRTTTLINAIHLGQTLPEASAAELPAACIRIVRNAIFARHGHPFASAELQRLFGALPWYQKQQGKSTKLSASERRQVANLSELERRRLFDERLESSPVYVDVDVPFASWGVAVAPWHAEWDTENGVFTALCPGKSPRAGKLVVAASPSSAENIRLAELTDETRATFASCVLIPGALSPPRVERRGRKRPAVAALIRQAQQALASERKDSGGDGFDCHYDRVHVADYDADGFEDVLAIHNHTFELCDDISCADMHRDCPKIPSTDGDVELSTTVVLCRSAGMRDARCTKFRDARDGM